MEQETTLDWQEITQEEFQSYENVRESGVTNMYMVSVVEDLSGLEKDTIFEIMRHYSELNTKYPGVRL